jgi:uncharacterized membrane protein
MKIDWRREALPLAAIAMTFIIAVAVYPRVPDPMPTHWDAAGVPNGYGPRLVGVFLLPAMTVGIYLLFLVLPRIDPRRANYERFADTYRFFRTLFILFMLFVFIITLAAVFRPGYRLNSALMFVAVGFLLAALGNYLPRVQSNWFVGIRTPWTLSSEEVWRGTHRLGGQVMVVSGIVMALAGLVWPAASFAIFVAAALAMSVVPIAYSYILYRRLDARRKEDHPAH